MKRHAGPLLAAVAIIVFDQLTKAWLVAAVAPFTGFSVIPGTFDIVHARNTGVAFSMFAGSGKEWVRPALSAVSAIASVFMLLFMRTLPSRSISAWGVGLVLGGALGNLIDRVRLGYVVDFLDVYWRTHHWPAFNVADAAITVGAVLLALDLIKNPPKE